MIKSSKLGGILLGEELGFLDILKILAVLDILFCPSSILGYYKDDEGRGLSLLISFFFILAPMSIPIWTLGVLAFFKSIIQSLIEISDSLGIKYNLEEIDVLVEKAIDMIVKKHFVQLSLQRTLKCLTDEESLTIYKIVEKFLEEDTISHVISGLRMLLYFGDNEEVTCVARFLGILAKFGIYDKYLTKGLDFYCKIVKKNSSKAITMKKRGEN